MRSLRGTGWTMRRVRHGRSSEGVESLFRNASWVQMSGLGVGVLQEQLREVQSQVFPSLSMRMRSANVSTGDWDSQSERTYSNSVSMSRFVQQDLELEEGGAENSAEPVAPSAPQSLSILVVDDERTLRHIECRMLSRMGHKTHSLTDGDQVEDFLAARG